MKFSKSEFNKIISKIIKFTNKTMNKQKKKFKMIKMKILKYKIIKIMNNNK